MESSKILHLLYVTVPVRATVAGLYRVLPVYAEMMYFTQVMGRSAGGQLVIEEKKVSTVTN